MDIRTLRYFVEVVRQQSFTRAAEKLFVTQPTISKMLKNLEDELNCTLLIRDGRKLLLTDTGRVVFERGLAILAEFRQLEAELDDINHLTKGLLRLGIPPMVGMMPVTMLQVSTINTAVMRPDMASTKSAKSIFATLLSISRPTYISAGAVAYAGTR